MDSLHLSTFASPKVNKFPYRFGWSFSPSPLTHHKLFLSPLCLSSRSHLAVAHAQDEIAGPVGVGHAVQCVLQAVVKLENIAENKGKGDTNARHFSKGAVRKGDANLANGHLVGGDASDAADPASPSRR